MSARLRGAGAHKIGTAAKNTSVPNVWGARQRDGQRVLAAAVRALAGPTADVARAGHVYLPRRTAPTNTDKGQ